MTTQSSQNVQANECIYTPPILPDHLASTYDLKPIVGQPKDEEIKMIHAAMRAVNTEAQVPHLCNPDLSLQLSQHLFSVQLAIYQNKYPSMLSSASNTYAPPSLPAHVSTIELDSVIGAPSDEQLKAAQHVVRVAENLVTSPLFNSDLNMQLSQHLFNLQFARCVKDSALGLFTSKPEEPQRTVLTTWNPFAAVSNIKAPAQSEPIPGDALMTEPANTGCSPSSGITQLGEAVDDIKTLMSESKGVLENMNRVLVAVQRNQFTVGEWNNHNLVHVNPVNDQGLTATECGLPQLRFTYHQGKYFNHLYADGLAGYLKFFGIGAHLLEDSERPRLKSGREPEAGDLIFKHIGMFCQI
ncbi:unnamed protein product [Rhizoctonia solani]|uniref:Uncharacterized protein n=1 Tax=Rhizoctonia solani TaxID=456999 RepID=A0A8H3DNT8_9AGAM|nr:unnamed protein product [Rhizoctonia solani]